MIRSYLFPVLILVSLFLCKPASADELVVLSPHWEGIRQEIAHGFQLYWKESRGREVTLRWLDVGGASDVVKYVGSEFGNKPEGIGADIVFGGGTDPFIELSRSDFLSPYHVPDELLRRIPEDLNGVPLYDKKRQWYAAALSTFGILYNKEVIRRADLIHVNEWRDLANPQLKSWIGAADPRKSGSIHLMYEAILQSYGWDEGWRILFGIGFNARNFSNTASQVVKDVASGEVAYGLAIDSYAFETIRRYGDDALGFLVPVNRSPVTGDAIAILRGAPNREVAEGFVSFVLSDTAQKIFYLKKGVPGGPVRFELAKLSVVPALYSTETKSVSRLDNPFSQLSDFRYDATKAARRWTIVNDLIGAWIVDNRDRLAGASQESVTTLPVPLSESRAADLAEGNYSRERSRLIRDWSVQSGQISRLSTANYKVIPYVLPVLMLVVLLAGLVVRTKK